MSLLPMSPAIPSIAAPAAATSPRIPFDVGVTFELKDDIAWIMTDGQDLSSGPTSAAAAAELTNSDKRHFFMPRGETGSDRRMTGRNQLEPHHNFTNSIALHFLKLLKRD